MQRGHQFAIVDEVDSILIDEARTPLIISGPADGGSNWYVEFARLAPLMEKDVHYEVDIKSAPSACTSSVSNSSRISWASRTSTRPRTRR